MAGTVIAAPKKTAAREKEMGGRTRCLAFSEVDELPGGRDGGVSRDKWELSVKKKLSQNSSVSDHDDHVDACVNRPSTMR